MNAIRSAGARYFQILQALSLKTDDAGRTAFFPLGRRPQGYLVDPIRERQLRRSINAFWSIAIVAGVVGNALIGYVAFVLVLPLIAGYWWWSNRAVNGLPVASITQTRADVTRSQIAAMGTRGIIVLLVLSGAMTALSTAAFLTTKPTKPTLLLGIGLFGLGTVRFGVLLVKARRQARSDH